MINTSSCLGLRPVEDPLSLEHSFRAVLGPLKDSTDSDVKELVTGKVLPPNLGETWSPWNCCLEAGGTAVFPPARVLPSSSTRVTDRGLHDHLLSTSSLHLSLVSTHYV